MKKKPIRLFTAIWLFPLIILSGILVIPIIIFVPHKARLKYIVPIGYWLQSQFYEPIEQGGKK